MKKLILLLCAAIALLPVRAQSYKPGDAINVDGWICLVISVDESGQHGRVMSPASMRITDDVKKQMRKSLDKAAETKGMELDLSEEAMLRTAPLELGYTMDKKKVTFNVDEWKAKMPEGWELPTLKDVEDFCAATVGGIGKNNKFGTDKSIAIATGGYPGFALISSQGFLFCDDKGGISSLISKGAAQRWFEVTDKFQGNECTVAVKAF